MLFSKHTLSAALCWTVMIIAVTMSSSGVRCQEGGDGVEDALDMLDGVDARPGNGDAPGVDTETAEDYSDLFDDLSTEELERLVKTAARRRLRIEREMFIDELEQEELFERSVVAKAAKQVTDSPKNTRADNIERICAAAALVDDIFGSAYALYREGAYGKAADELKEFINVQDTTYLSAAMQFIYARSLLKAGKKHEAVDVYRSILINLPDRVSFAAASAKEAAEAYREMGRGSLALEMYSYYLKNYNLTMSEKEVVAVWDEVERLKKIYSDPMKSLTRMMGEVHGRLEKKDAGEQTIQKEAQVVALLEDLIKSAEERQGGGQGQQNQNQKGNKKGAGKGKGKGKGKAAGEADGGRKGDPSGKRNNPTTGAKASALVPGEVSRPTRMSEKFEGNDAGKWADLPPRQREKVREMLKRNMGGRWGGLIREYHSRISEGE